MEDTKFRYWRLNNPLLWGVLGSLIIFLGALVLAMRESCVVDALEHQNCVSLFKKFMNSSPNEMGDTLAGLAGSLAFLWIIVTVALQSQELSEQRKELRLARKEAARMADAMGAQAELFKDEQRQRREAENAALADELLSTLKHQLIHSGLINASWYFSSHDDEGQFSPKGVRIYLFERFIPEAKGEELIISVQGDAVGSAHEDLKHEASNNHQHVRPPAQRFALVDLHATLKNLKDLRPYLSRTNKEKLRRLRIDEFECALRKLLADRDLNLPSAAS